MQSLGTRYSLCDMKYLVVVDADGMLVGGVDIEIV